MFHDQLRISVQNAVATALLMAVAGGAAAQVSQTAVGQVSLVIGEAHVVHADGSRELVRRGASILVGDRVETAQNGHVHVGFVDKGVVSVRPESLLEVQSYRYDAQNPAANEVRLRLDRGASRSISGAATEVDKSRFRLNTPIAAIGVRGTDFIVQTDSSGMRATVADGAIVVGPLSGDCTAGSMGPCSGEAVRVLSAGMGQLMAEVRSGEGRTRLVPATGAVLAAVGTRSDDGLQQRPQSEPLTYSVNDTAAADLLVIAKDNIPAAAGSKSLNVRADLSGQLIWGRWGVSTSEDKVAVTASLAAIGRHFTGIGDSEMGLYRANQTIPGPLLAESLNATVDFRLSRASATFERGSTSEAATIEGGSLRIDFARRTFATGLLLSSASGGDAKLLGGGDVRANGTFAVKDAGQTVAGAVSLDGKEAGYLFERGANGGVFKGHTLWGAVPGR